MFRTAKIMTSLATDWEYTMTSDDARDLGYLLRKDKSLKALSPTAAAGMFLCFQMKESNEFITVHFPEILVKILNLPYEREKKLSRREADILLELATSAVTQHQHLYLKTYSKQLYPRNW